MIVSMDKKYQTRDGRPVRILCVDGPDARYPVLYVLEDSRVLRTKCDGAFESADSRSHYDLIEVSPYADFKVDDPVMVRAHTAGDVWHRRYFASIHHTGEPMTWSEGRTSWSRYDAYDLSTWSECRRPTAEELGEMKWDT